MVFEEATERDWKYLSLALLLAGLAYVFFDVALSGVINLYSVLAYVVVFIVVFVGSQFFKD